MFEKRQLPTGYSLCIVFGTLVAPYYLYRNFDAIYYSLALLMWILSLYFFPFLKAIFLHSKVSKNVSIGCQATSFIVAAFLTNKYGVIHKYRGSFEFTIYDIFGLILSVFLLCLYIRCYQFEYDNSSE